MQTLKKLRNWNLKNVNLYQNRLKFSSHTRFSHFFNLDLNTLILVPFWFFDFINLKKKNIIFAKIETKNCKIASKSSEISPPYSFFSSFSFFSLVPLRSFKNEWSFLVFWARIFNTRRSRGLTYRHARYFSRLFSLFVFPLNYLINEPVSYKKRGVSYLYHVEGYLEKCTIIFSGKCSVSYEEDDLLKLSCFLGPYL